MLVDCTERKEDEPMKYNIYLMAFVIGLSILPAHAEQRTFICYDVLDKKRGLYEKYKNTAGIRFYPTELTFDTELRTMTMKTGADWRCHVVSWGDSLIYTTCLKKSASGTIQPEDILLGVGVFNRNNARFAFESVSNGKFSTLFDEAEVGEKNNSVVTVPYDVCEEKAF